MPHQLLIALKLLTASHATDIATPPTSDTVAPYERIFQANQEFQLASSSEQGTGRCRVVEVATRCSDTEAQIECDGDAQILSGTYLRNARGMFREGSETRLFARFPESHVDGAGRTIAQPYHGGWCTTDAVDGGTRTICISETNGFTGAAFIAPGKRIVVGDVPLR